MANRNPFGLALVMQREAVRQGQRTVEQGVEAQRAMTEAFVHNAIGMGRAANRNATEATRQGMVTVAGMMDAMTPAGANSRTSVERGFESVADAQENAWRVFERGAEDGLAAYAQFADSGVELFSDSMDATLDAHRSVGRRSTDAAVEYERQERETHATSGRGRPEPVDIEPEEADEASVEAGESVTETGESAAETGEAGEPVTEAGESTSGPTLEDLAGVGSAYADRLRTAGIESVEQLQEADVASLSEETEISDERLANWQRQAHNLLDEE